MTVAQTQLDLGLLSSVLRHDREYHRILAEEEDRGRWVLFYNPKIALIRDANKAAFVRAAEEEAAAFLDEVEAFYTGYGATPACYLDPLSRPAGLRDALRERGYEPEPAEVVLMTYQGGPLRRPEPADARLHVATYHQWRGYIDVASQWERNRRMRAQWAWRAHEECADPRVRNYIAYVEGKPAAVASLFAWEGIGRVESVRTAARYRRRGLAGALVQKAVYDSLNMKNRLTYLFVTAGNPAQGIYKELGFELGQRAGWGNWVKGG